MEKRHYPRVSAALWVELSHRGRCQGTYGTGDIGMEVMFLKSGPPGLVPNDKVRMVVAMDGVDYRLSGIVVHRSGAGIGVGLRPGNRDLFWALFYLFKERGVSLNRSLVGLNRAGTLRPADRGSGPGPASLSQNSSNMNRGTPPSPPPRAERV